MLTSKELLEKSGISRATLNNYIALGILPKPVVQKPAPGRERAPQLGYFPEDVLERVEAVRRLKKEGLSMAEIVEKFKAGPEPEGDPSPTTIEDGREERGAAGVVEPTAASVRLTLDQLDNPAYMVNYNFSVEWCNKEAATAIFGLSTYPEPRIEARNFFKLFLNSRVARGWEDREELLRFHLSIAKVKLPKRSLDKLTPHISNEDLARLDDLYDETDLARPGSLVETYVNLSDLPNEPKWHNVYATFFREGVLFIHLPVEAPAEALFELLSRRDQLICDLFKSRHPLFTPLCVLVADLQDSVKICAELPPEEYIELINQIWQMSETILRKYHATQGKHAGDGMVSYFFPQPDSNFLFNTFLAAKELREKMRGMSEDWRLRKNWTNELHLNIGLNEGEEWVGTYHTATNLEFTVLGETINYAGRLSDFARFGAVWATKNLVGRLSCEERERLRYGIRRIDMEGNEIWVPSTFSRLSNLIDLGNEKYEKFRDIANLAITEVGDVASEEETPQPQGGN